MEKQKTALQIAIEEFEKYGGELISGDSVSSFLKSLLPTERKQIETAYNSGENQTLYESGKNYFTCNFQNETTH